MVKIKKRWMILGAFFLLLPLAFADGITIKNLGQLGFNGTNPEYTSLRTVILETNFSGFSTNCSYSNDDITWLPFEPCQLQRYWLLDEGAGLKTVYTQIEYPVGPIMSYNDSIYYNYTGAGLDTTPPSEVAINDGDYSNSNETLNFSWSESSDAESEILGIPLVYSYIIYINGAPNSSWTQAGTGTSISYTTALNHSDNVTITVNATNSAGLSSSKTSDGIIIDFVQPNSTDISSDLLQVTWYSNSSVFFNWSSSDDLSGIGGFSYTLSQAGTTVPDDIPEGPTGELENHKNTTFTGLKTAEYYFKIKAKDRAGNWGNISSYEIWIDRTAPAKPLVESIERVFGTSMINITWSESFDEHSGVWRYTLEIWNSTDFNYSTSDLQQTVNLSNTTFFYEYTPSIYSETFYARIRAVDNAGNPSAWSNEETNYDTTPPIITIIKPKALVEQGQSPVLAASTDEQATCYFENSTGGLVIFTFTNSTYHETKPGDGQTTYDINCTDASGNSATSSTGAFGFDANQVSGLETPLSPEGYIGQVITLSANTTPAKGEIPKDRFKVYINSSETDFTILDEGAGKYWISFMMPKTQGSYALSISADNSVSLATLTAKNLELVSIYDDNIIASSVLGHIIYYNSTNSTAGFGTDSGFAAFGQAGDAINATLRYDGRLYFFVTKKSGNSMLALKDEQLKASSFSSQKNPSFGYPSKDYSILKCVLAYNKLAIAGNDTLTSGQHNILIKRVQNESKKTLLVTSKVGSYNERSVMEYG